MGILASSFLAQHVALRVLDADGTQGTLRLLIFFLSAAALVMTAMHFRRFAGAWLIAAGIILNFVPMAANNAMMPASYEVAEQSGAFPEITADDIGKQLGRHILLAEEDIAFFPLADRYFIQLPLIGRNIYSVGDVVELAGLVLVVAQVAAMAAAGRLRRLSGNEVARGTAA